MRSGRLRHRVTLLKPARTTDGYGQVKTSSSPVGTYWAWVRPLRGREAEVARQLRADLTHAVTLRYVGAIGAEDSLLFRGRGLNIRSVIDVDERRREINLLCVEVLTP